MIRDNIVVGIGEVLWDCLPSGRQLGGAPANFAYHVSQFGLPAYVVSAVGKDSLGDEIKSLLLEKNLNLCLADSNKPTGTVQVSVDEKGVPQYDICKNVAWDNIPFTNDLRVLAEKTSAVCFGSLAQRNELSRNTILSFIDSMPDGSLKVFDINLRQNYYSKHIIETSLYICNMLKINDEELNILQVMLKDNGDAKSFCYRLMNDFHINTIVLTCGENGSYVYGNNDEVVSFIETPKVKVVDTVGAGDSFTAAFVASLLMGKSLCEAHKTAVDISAFVCTRCGAMPSYIKK